MIKSLSSSLLCAAIYAGLTGSGHALNARTWVSGTGVDQAGCGPIANPCRTLQYAHDNTSAGGEVNFKDSAGYGSVAVIKAISIIADGVFAGVLAGAGQSAITINAGASDAVVLRGLSIEGAGVALNGIVLKSGGALTIANCWVQNFDADLGTGIFINHAAGSPNVAISNTITSSNSYVGMWYYPSGSGGGTFEIDRSTVNMQQWGIALNMSNSSGNVLATVSNSIVYGNSKYGIYTEGGTAKVKIKLETSIISKSPFGFFNQGTGYIGRTSIVGNNTGVNAGGTTYSFGNNEIGGNTTDVSGALTPIAMR